MARRRGIDVPTNVRAGTFRPVTDVQTNVRAACLLLAGVALCAGCASWGSPVGMTPEFEDAVRTVGLTDKAAAPATLASTLRPLPGLIQTTYAYGAIWIGYNPATAEGGILEQYDAGSGVSFGVAFGNGEDVKGFVEVGYECTGDHEVYSGGTLTSVASHERFYVGLRRYLLPVVETRARIAPFVVGGVTYQKMSGSAAVSTENGWIQIAEGSGFFLGTGIEIYVGSSSQVALCLDVRAAIVNFDGFPEGTGTQSTIGESLLLVYHF